jgi:hypothetical protein
MEGYSGSGGIKITNFKMKQYEKMHFNSYKEAELWMSETSIENDGVIRKEPDGKYYIFIEKP